MQYTTLSRIANTVRAISLEAVARAGSGHAGLPLGCAEIGAFLFGDYLRLHCKHLDWPNRDILILSAGHGSIWLYSFLHFLGYLSVEDLEKYRTINSKTPSHPEFGKTLGIEATTGTDGQGIGFAVGRALASKILAAKFNTKKHTLFSNKIICLAGDGCFMEGISSESSSIAGHMGLDNLILIYDSNKTCLDGLVAETFSEDIELRYKSCGWDVYEVDGHDFKSIDQVLATLRTNQTKPALIIANTIIGKGAAKQEGTPLAHSGPLGSDTLATIKNNLRLSSKSFAIPEDVTQYFNNRALANQNYIKDWHNTLKAWELENPVLAKEYHRMQESPSLDPLGLAALQNMTDEREVSGRSASNIIINLLADHIPSLYGGSADLARSDGTFIHKYSFMSRDDLLSRNIKYGVREFAMGSIAAGLSLSNFFTPFIGTFLAFSDYMRNAIRITAMMKVQVIYQFTHDSFLIGEDGPTHQPIEQIVTLRAIPNLRVIRPADFFEVKWAWLKALNYQGPTALILSRQELPLLGNVSRENIDKGAYIVLMEKTISPEIIILATGSEVCLALQVADALQPCSVRVISMPCLEIFNEQDDIYKEKILAMSKNPLRVSIEAGVSQGWHRYIGADGLAISIESFGETGSSELLRIKFGFDVASITTRIKKRLNNHVISKSI